MWSSVKSELTRRLADRIRNLYEVDHDPVVEIPPRRDLGDIAFPAALHLARVVKRNPRQIATEILEGLELPPEVRSVEIAGAGYLNAFLQRSAGAAHLLAESAVAPSAAGSKTVIEHTNINPNKAAHIGHLRNSVLGDILAKTLRELGHTVEVQNYIDDTGVQVADVVVGFLDIQGLDAAAVAAIPEPFDYYCWDLYSQVGRWFEEDPERLTLRRSTLHELESGSGPRADIGRLVARRIVARHLKTMARLDISYDLLTHESDILGLDFFRQAFDRLVASGAIHLENSGKNEGCWVMPLAESEEFAGLEDPDKVIVRSDGTVTYVGKDIAYQLWKFGLLGRDFEYRYWDEQELWQTTTTDGVAKHPSFGGAHDVINVIDIRQSYLQKIVRAGLEALGHPEAAERSVHFAYEMVALSTDTARQLGYIDDDADPDEEGKSLEMSGRKGVGVKADDLMDQLIAKAREEIESRDRELAADQLTQLARDIAVAALRFFMVKASTHRIIAFDFSEALSFEGESGPYLQYALVRAENIRRKLAASGLETEVAPEIARQLPEELWSDDLWDLVLCAAQIGDTLEKAGSTLELSLIARHALDLAQKFNALYHRHPMLHEENEDLRRVRLVATRVFSKALMDLARILGIPTPDRM
ncbi:MAG: arginine--tRNA ligase [Thermoanaerobaculia bacterium]|nr:arginine--tRNA ligase [Thermoanaerobaculia bacterium]